MILGIKGITASNHKIIYIDIKKIFCILYYEKKKKKRAKKKKNAIKNSQIALWHPLPIMFLDKEYWNTGLCHVLHLPTLSF